MALPLYQDPQAQICVDGSRQSQGQTEGMRELLPLPPPNPGLPGFSPEHPEKTEETEASRKALWGQACF